MPTTIPGIAPQPPEPIQGSVDSAMTALGGMDSEGFLKLLVAQLQYQSPLDPKDPGDLMTQTAALAQLDASQQLLAVQQRDLGMQQAVAATGLLGAEVDATDQDGPVQGIVEAIRYTTAGPVLVIGEREVMFSDVTGVRHVPAAEVIPEPALSAEADGEVTTANSSGALPGTVPIPDVFLTDRPTTNA